ncbi:unnamed protein product, partial [Polarella glacialis]
AMPASYAPQQFHQPVTFAAPQQFHQPVTYAAPQQQFSYGEPQMQAPMQYGAPPVNYGAPVHMQGAPMTYAPQQGGMTMFDQIDKNHDGVLSREEYARAMSGGM